MTLNQLKYWELRWKQFYDMRQLEIDRKKLDLEVAKLSETIRHNKKSEKQESQRIVNERMEISRKWAELSETIRSNIVNEGIKAYKELETHRHNVADEERRLMEVLGNQAIALGDLMVEAESAKNNNTVAFIKAYGDNVGEFLKAFGGGMASTGLAELRSALGAESYDNVVQSVIDQFPQFKDVLTTKGVAGVNYHPSNQDDISKWYTETYGPEANKKIQDDAKKSIPKYPHDFDDSGLVQGFSNSQDGSKSTNTTTGSSVISYDVPGVKSTPQRVSGGLKSSAVIYAGKG